MNSRTPFPSANDTEGPGLGHGCRHHGDQFKFFTIRAVAEMLDVSPRTVRRWIDDGDLVAYRRGGVVRIEEKDLRAFLAAHRDQ